MANGDERERSENAFAISGGPRLHLFRWIERKTGDVERDGGEEEF